MESEHTNTNPVNEKMTPPATIEQPKPHAPDRYPASPKLYQLRKYFVYVLVGGLILSALIAIVAVLAGNMSGIIGKSIFTVFVIIVHSLIALGFISITSTKQPNKGSALIVNTLFGITVLSLITAMLGVWEVVTDGEFILRQYSVFFSAFITSLVLYGLFQATEQDKATIVSRNTAVGSSLLAFILLLPIQYDIGTLPEFYFRFLTANNIVVGVSIVITVIFHWYFMSKHPELRNNGATQKQLSVGTLIGRGILILIAIWLLMLIFAGIFEMVMDTQQPRVQPMSSPRYY